MNLWTFTRLLYNTLIILQLWKHFYYTVCTGSIYISIWYCYGNMSLCIISCRTLYIVYRDGEIIKSVNILIWTLIPLCTWIKAIGCPRFWTHQNLCLNGIFNYLIKQQCELVINTWIASMKWRFLKDSILGYCFSMILLSKDWWIMQKWRWFWGNILGG